MIAVAMVGVTYASRSERFKTWFANYGFESFTAVKYAAIGAKNPETALESVGARLDADFMDGDQDFDDDAPQLMSYMGGGGNDRASGGDGDARARTARRDVDRRRDAPTAQVPRLAAPPGGGGALGRSTV